MSRSKRKKQRSRPKKKVGIRDAKMFPHKYADVDWVEVVRVKSGCDWCQDSQRSEIDTGTHTPALPQGAGTC